MYTWVENALGAAQKDNLEQLNGLDFYHDAIQAARAYLGDYESNLNITVSGHSTAGNIAQYVTITYPKYEGFNEINDIDRCVSVDGQGFSLEFLDYPEYKELIYGRADKITSIVPHISFVGSL